MLLRLISLAGLIFISLTAFADDGNEIFERGHNLADLISSSEVNSDGFYPLEGFEVMKDLYGLDHEMGESSRKIVDEINQSDIYTNRQKILLGNVVYATDIMGYGSGEYAKNKDFSRLLFSTSLCSAKLFSGNFLGEVMGAIERVLGEDSIALHNYEIRSMAIQAAYRWPLPEDDDFRYICGMLMDN